MHQSSVPSDDTLRKIIHELNGELFLIRGNLELARECTQADAPIHNHLENIKQRTEEISKLVKRLKAKQIQLEPKHE